MQLNHNVIKTNSNFIKEKSNKYLLRKHNDIFSENKFITI